MLTLKEYPIENRPRERLQSNGPQSLGDADLLAVLLGSGVHGRDVYKVAAELLPRIDSAWPDITMEGLREVHGIGAAKATLILAALEFTRRRICPRGIKIKGPQDVLPLVQHLIERKQEHFICISLNGAHEVIATRIVTIGLLNATQVHPREVFCDPIVDRACSIVVAHNHPSGNMEPSEEDRRVTRTLKEAAAVLGIKLLDHVIFGDTGGRYYSFADSGELR